MEPNYYGGLEDDFPCKWVIFRFHVNFQGCTPHKFKQHTSNNKQLCEKKCLKKKMMILFFFDQKKTVLNYIFQQNLHGKKSVRESVSFWPASYFLPGIQSMKWPWFMRCTWGQQRRFPLGTGGSLIGQLGCPGGTLGSMDYI